MRKGRTIGLALLAVIALCVAGLMGSYLNMCSRVATAPARVVNRIVDEDNIIQNYEWYHDAYQKSLAYDLQLANATGAYGIHIDGMDADSYHDKVEKARLSSVVLGIRNERASLVKQYNSRSAQLTRNKFKGWNLPYRLEIVDDKTVEVYE